MQYVPDWHFVVAKCSNLHSAQHHHAHRLSSLPMPSFNIHILTPTHYEFVIIFVFNYWPNEVKTVGTSMTRRKIDKRHITAGLDQQQLISIVIRTKSRTESSPSPCSDLNFKYRHQWQTHLDGACTLQMQ